MLLFRLYFDFFSFLLPFTVFEVLWYDFVHEILRDFSSLVFGIKCERFCNSFKFKFLYFRVAVIYADCCYHSNYIPFFIVVHFGHQGLNEQKYFQKLLKRSQT